MSPSFSVLSSVCRRGVVAAAIVVACGSTVAMADVITVASGKTIPGLNNTPGSQQIRALSARSLWTAGGAAQQTNAAQVNYGFGDTYQFATLTSSLFTAAQGAPTASIIGTAGGWNNPSNTTNGWTPTAGNPATTAYASTLNTNGARWIGSPGNNGGSNGDSVLFAIPFNPGNNTLANITLTYASDNQLGSGTNSGGASPGPAGYVNSGVYFNGASVALTPTPRSGQPNEYQVLRQITISGLHLVPNTVNWLYLHEFNSGGPGGTGFVANISMVPLPAPVWGGIAGLASVGCIAAVRRRRMA